MQGKVWNEMIRCRLQIYLTIPRSHPKDVQKI